MCSFCQYKLFVDIRGFFTENCRQTGVRWLKSPNLQFSWPSSCYTVYSLFHKKSSTLLDMTTAPRSEFLLVQVRMTLNDPKFPIQVQLRVGTPDVHVYSTVCCGFRSGPFVTERTSGVTTDPADPAMRGPAGLWGAKIMALFFSLKI